MGSHRVDQDLARAALLKQAQGLEPTRDQARALARWQNQENHKSRWAAYESIPKKDYREMSGLTDKTILSHRDRYELSALDGPTVNLPTLLRQVHSLLSKHWIRFTKDIEGDSIMLGGLEKSSPAAERHRGIKAEIAQLDLDVKRGELTPRVDARIGLQRIVRCWRAGVEHLGREYGPAAAAIMNDAVDAAAKEVHRIFPGSEQDSDYRFPGGDDLPGEPVEIETDTKMKE